MKIVSVVSLKVSNISGHGLVGKDLTISCGNDGRTIMKILFHDEEDDNVSTEHR